MGMSASQARFLSLTARQTNLEFEGQQINQQRTSLSNESAAYYSRLTAMAVPTPPSTADYTKVVYNFSDGQETSTITSMIAQRNGYYLVSYSTSIPTSSVVPNGTVLVLRENSGTAEEPNYSYYVGTSKLRDAGEDDPQDTYLASLSAEDRAQTLRQERQYLAILQEKYNDNDWMVRYTKNSVGTYSPVFYSKTQLKNTKYNNNGISISGIKSYSPGDTVEVYEQKGLKARTEMGVDGRYKSLTIYTETEDGEVETTYQLEVNVKTDEAAYNDAMNKYNYDKELYAQQIQDINSKLEIIQAQDRSLELKLKQLDTERQALTTESEAIAKVISKNISDTFNVFSKSA